MDKQPKTSKIHQLNEQVRNLGNSVKTEKQYLATLIMLTLCYHVAFSGILKIKDQKPRSKNSACEQLHEISIIFITQPHQNVSR